MTKLYLLYLDGQLYGAGNGDYMVELIRDYIVGCELYGHKQADFTVKVKE